MLTMIIQIAVAFVATVSFAVLFQVPKEQYVYSGICGAAGWWCYLLVMANYPSPTVSFCRSCGVDHHGESLCGLSENTGYSIFDLWIVSAGPRRRNLLHSL